MLLVCPMQMSLFKTPVSARDYYVVLYMMHRSQRPSQVNDDHIAPAFAICKVTSLGPWVTPLFGGRVKHGNWLLFSSSWGWVWGLEWKLKVKMTSWRQMLPSLCSKGLCLSVDYFLPHSDLLPVTKWHAGKELGRVGFSFTSSPSSFLPCTEFPLWSGRMGI